jgi:hypothetical protein
MIRTRLLLGFFHALLTFFLAIPGEALADVPIFSTGPSVSFFRFGFKLNDPSNASSGDKAGVDVLAAGVGWSVRWNPSKLVSKDGQVSYMSLDGTIFGNLGALPTSGGMSIAAGPSFYNGLVGLEVGYKLFELTDAPNRPMEGLFAGGYGGRRNVFVLVNMSVNLLFQGSNPTLHAAKKGASANEIPPNYWRVGG